MLGGPLLRVGLVLGGMISAFGMFNALVMSYSRLPLAMAQDGMLPGVFGKLHPKTRAPWVAILVLAMGWALCLAWASNGWSRSTSFFTAPACSGVRGADRAPGPRAGAAAALSGARRNVWSYRHRHYAYAAAGLLDRPQRE